MNIKFGKEMMRDSKGYTICVNPGLECLGVIYVLSGFELNVARTNHKYLTSVKGYFYKYRTHPVVAKFKELLNRDEFKYDAPVEFFLNVFYDVKPSKELLKRAGITMKEYKSILKLINDFVEVSEFERFIKQTERYYKANMDKFHADMLKFNPSRYLFDFLGENSSFLNVILMFGVCTANYGVKVKDELYCCVRPYKESRYDDEIDFAYDQAYMTTLILHEFAHSFINPMTAEYRKEMSKMKKEKFKSIFDNNPYGEHIETAINELVIRAIECEYIKAKFKTKYFNFRKAYVDEGFVLISDVESICTRYLNERNKYKTFREFYPEVMKYFIELK